MNRPKKIYLLAAFFIICLLSATDSLAQTPAAKTSEPSFDVVLQTIVASNEAGEKSDNLQSLSGIAKKLKSDFSFSAYRLTGTFVQRVSNAGNSEFKGLAYEPTDDKNYPTFSEWSLSGLQNSADENGRETVQIRNFRFGQRIPIKNPNGATTYEQVGLSTQFGLPKNTPTIIGTVTTGKPGELMFVILTVKPAEKTTL